MEFRIGLASGPKFREAFRKAARELLAANGGEELTKDQIRAAFREALARVTLKDWKGIVDAEGAAVPFSIEKAIEILSDARYAHLRDFVAEVAEDLARYGAVESGN